jgi:hypothetical protein
MKQILLISSLLTSLLLISVTAWSADQVQAQDQLEAKEQVLGRELMTNEERIEHRKKMRAATTAEERERIQKEHHERMKIRAKERGVTLPDEPLFKGGRMGKGQGSGQGRGR